MRTTLLTLTFITAIASPLAAQIVIAPADQAKPGPATQKPAQPAQTTKPKPKPVPKLPLGFHGFFLLESNSMSASSTFKAQTGSSSLMGVGAGGEVLNIWRKVFLRAALSASSVTGERGFVLDDGFQSTGIPVDIGVRYFEIAGGWRTYLKKHPRVALYVGGGLLFGTISQESPLAEAGDNGSETGTGFVLLGGLEYAVWHRVVVGVEGEFRSVGGVLGNPGSVSGGFLETNAGGAAIRALVGFRFRK
jgi:hypothetical protein